MKYEEWISAKGFDPASSDAQRTTLAAAFEGEQTIAAPATGSDRGKRDSRCDQLAALIRCAALRCRPTERGICVRESLFDNLVEL